MLGCKELKSFHTSGRSNALLLPIIPVSMHILLLIFVIFNIFAIIIVVCVVIGFVVVIIIIIILISIFLLYRRLVYLSRSLSAKKWRKGQVAKRIHDWNPVCTVQVPHVGVWNRYSQGLSNQKKRLHTESGLVPSRRPRGRLEECTI